MSVKWKKSMVDIISAINSPQGGVTPPSGKERNAMGRDAFMKLLLVQLRNQDPQNPLKSHEFASQLAQFTSVEQLFNINDKLDRNLELDITMSQSLGNSLATTIVGKNVRAIGNEISYDDGKATDVYIDLSKSAANVTLSIFDSNDTLVRKVDMGTMTAGESTFTWDGENNDEVELAEGIYTFSIDASGSNGEPVPVTFYMGGHITGVKFSQDNTTAFLVGALSISVADVVMITEPENN